jgi:hypothetical protein
MFRITQVMSLAAALAVMPAAASAQGSGQRSRTYQEDDAATKTTFTATRDANGNAVLTLKGGDFVLEKVMAATGDTTLRLSQDKDVVSIAINQSGFQVARGSETVRVDPRSDREDKVDAVRSVLLGSQAIRSFKRLVAAIEARDETEEDGPLALSTLVDGGIVLLLDGDPDSARRIAKRMTRKQRAGLLTISAKRAPGVYYYDCVGGYQVALLDAWGQLEECYIESTEYSWWSRSMVFTLCRWEWAIRSQQYLWQFVSCFMFPW